MFTPTGLRGILLASLLCMVGTVGCDESSHPLAETSRPELQTSEDSRRSSVQDPLTVMSRNLYHGGDISPVLAVGFSDLKLLTETAAGIWAEVKDNDFNVRAPAIVDEIQRGNPDVVGFQELAMFVAMDLNPATGATTITEVIDFQGILEAELANRGLEYTFVAVQNNTQVTVPVAGFEMGAQFVPTKLVTLIVRDGVLVRDDLTVSAVSQQNYQAFVPLGIDPFGNPIHFLRGWIRVDLSINGVPHHFFNTHLEIQSFAPIQHQQTAELLNEAEGLDGITVMTGDFNSDAAGGPGDPSWTESYDMIRAAGFTDAWNRRSPRPKKDQGLTCCQASDLRNEMSTFYQRIDFVFIRLPERKGPRRNLPGRVEVDVVGDELADRIGPDGLWPSDHAGVVADFWLPTSVLH